MKLEFQIDKEDFLNFQLFAASQSERINRKKRNGRIFLTIGTLVAALVFYIQDNYVIAIYSFCIAILCGFFYPNYFRWRYKKHYNSVIKENYSSRFGQNEYLELNDDHIFTKDKTGESKINLSEIEKVDETQDHFFLKISSGHFIIIPKKGIVDTDALRSKLQAIGFSVNDLTNWKWR